MCRIETFQPSVRVLTGELPVRLGMDTISMRLPRVNLPAHLVNEVGPAIQTLARHHTDSCFGHIQHLFHRGCELGIAVGRSHPFEAIPVLDLVCFRILRTVS